MQKHTVRKIRDNDPEEVQRLADFGLTWLVIRASDQKLGRAFTTFKNAVGWAIQDHKWLAS